MAAPPAAGKPSAATTLKTGINRCLLLLSRSRGDCVLREIVSVSNGDTMTKVAVLDDWQGVARGSADWSPLLARAEVVFFAQPFCDEDDAARKLADFDIILSMRERTPLPASLINRLPRLRMLGMTGARNASLDTACCTSRGVLVCNTVGGAASQAATAELALGLLLSAARAIPAADSNMRAG